MANRDTSNSGRSLALACVLLGSILCVLTPDRASAQARNGPRSDASRLLQVLDSKGFEALEGRFRILDPPPMACAGYLPTTWYNNVQPYMSVILPGAVGEPVAWERTERVLFPSYLFRQDDVFKPVSALSGGERGRLALAILALDEVNFLLNAAEIIPQQQVLDSLRLFAREVMPAFDGASRSVAAEDA